MSPNYKEYNPTILIIFGATGDLMQRKLVPALFHLFEKKMLPAAFQVVGFARRDLGTEGFRAHISDILKKIGTPDQKIGEFIRYFVYQQGYFDDMRGYKDLAGMLGMKDDEWRACSNKLFYLAVPPDSYETIFNNLKDSGLTKPCSPEEGWTRVIVEKPFGRDLKTAEHLDTLLGRLFREEQIYRIDHYLGKETSQNILAFRFSNSFFETSWDRDSIESIHIRLSEEIGVETRADSYDAMGALRDVGQNHLLQLLALFTMEPPESFDAFHVRAKRREVLEELKVPTISDTVRGQYEGYKKEQGVPDRSHTETYFKIRTFLDAPRWEGVPIYLESGKKLSESKVNVRIIFRHSSPCLCPPGRHLQNILEYRIQPDEGVSASFWVKKPGPKMILEEKDFSFNYRRAYPEVELLDAYEKLLLDAIEGNQTLFVSTEEIKASWKFIDAITDKWENNPETLLPYRPGMQGLELPFPGEKGGQKQIGFIGLGKMGKNMAVRLAEKGWDVRVFDANPAALQGVEEFGLKPFADLASMTEELDKPRIIWSMITAGKGLDDLIFGAGKLANMLSPGDILIDGGNSFYEDSIRRAKKFSSRKIHFLDAGVSGGPAGARNGACIMVGGSEKAYRQAELVFRDLSIPDGYAYMGGSGAGHFVKMVHNGIEYGMMQAIAEGFSVLKKSNFKLDVKKIAKIYNKGSVIESRLMKWLEKGFEVFGPHLSGVSGSVGHLGEGEWTVKTAKKLNVPVPVIRDSFLFRVRSEKEPSYAGKILSALRNQFGGHSIKTVSKKKSKR